MWGMFWPAARPKGPDDRDALVVTDIDLDVAREVKKTWQFDEHWRPETYGKLVS